jgi:hypothetical protein
VKIEKLHLLCYYCLPLPNPTNQSDANPDSQLYANAHVFGGPPKSVCSPFKGVKKLSNLEFGAGFYKAVACCTRCPV